MKHTALCVSLALVIALPALSPALAQNSNVNTITSTVTVGPKPAPASHPVKPPQAKPATPAKSPATPGTVSTVVRKAPSATATGGSASVTGDASSTSSSSAQGGAGGQGGSASAGSVTVNGKARKREAASAIAPSIYTSSECGKGASGAVQTGVFGFSFGGTSTDAGCEARQDFNAFNAAGLDNAKATAMCMGTEAQKAAMESEGVDCEIQTRGRVRNKILKAGTALDLDRYCTEVIGDWEQDADRRKVCANVR